MVQFPGQRQAKHYFPVTKKKVRIGDDADRQRPRWYALGLDEVLVDIEVYGPWDVAERYGLIRGQSVHIGPEDYNALLDSAGQAQLKTIQSPGGTIANTLNNYTYLCGEPAVLLGAISNTIRPHDPSYAYLTQTPKAVDLSHLVGVAGNTGTAITYVGPDGDRAFGVAPGIAGAIGPEHLPEGVIEKASVVLGSLYAFGGGERPIGAACLKMFERAKAQDIPIAFGLGSAALVKGLQNKALEVLESYVTIAAMNADEARMLAGHDEVLRNCEILLDLCDMVIITDGARGLVVGAYTDESVKRATRDPLESGSIAEFNAYEFSRALRRRDCPNPLKIYSHAHPYRGGPDTLINASGAGDAALAAIMHDIAANRYHRARLPESEKHSGALRYLSYSSLSRNAQYGNRVAYEVLKSRFPRLDGPLAPPSPADDAD